MRTEQSLKVHGRTRILNPLKVLERPTATLICRDFQGLYSEQLADEIGMYRDFPQGRIGMLQAFLYRAARIVMDTGMHAKGWSREQTIRYFVDTVGLDERAATNEVERYVVWPGQACSYKIGHSEIVRLREQARARLGPRFDLKAFHDLVLLSGDMPLEVLAGMVDEWTGARQG